MSVPGMTSCVAANAVFSQPWRGIVSSMGMTCKVCRHPNREAIDKEIARGEGKRAIAGRWGLKPTSVERHIKRHLKAQPITRAEMAEKAMEHATWHLGNLRRIAEECVVVPRDYLLASREFARATELMGKFGGALTEKIEVTHVIEVPSIEGTAAKAARLLRELGYVVLEPSQNATDASGTTNGGLGDRSPSGNGSALPGGAGEVLRVAE